MKERILDWLFTLALAILLALFVWSFTGRVQAAPSENVPLCTAINTAGGIIVYRCLPDEGPSYLLNSFGFMLVED